MRTTRPPRRNRTLDALAGVLGVLGYMALLAVLVWVLWLFLWSVPMALADVYGHLGIVGYVLALGAGTLIMIAIFSELDA